MLLVVGVVCCGWWLVLVVGCVCVGCWLVVPSSLFLLSPMYLYGLDYDNACTYYDVRPASDSLHADRAMWVDPLRLSGPCI